MNIKILIDDHIFRIAPSGGIGRLYRELLPRVARRNPKIHFYVLCSEDTVSMLPKHDQIHPRYLALWDKRLSGGFSKISGLQKRRLDQQIKKLQPDIFHSTYYALPPIEGVKTVATVHDLIDYEFPLLMPNGPGFVDRQRAVLTQADHVICVSRSTMDSAARAFGLTPEGMTTVYNDASAVFQPKRPDVNSNFRKAHTLNKPFFLFVGEHRSYKNLSTVIRAFGQIRDKTDHLLLLAGHSIYRLEQHFVDLAIEHRIGDRIIRLHHPSDELLCQAYSSSDAFIFPSLQEGFGIPLIEAMRCQTPVIASDIPVFHEICGDAAMYFNPHHSDQLARSMLAIIESETKAPIILAGQEKSKLYSWDKSAELMEGIYVDLVS